MLNFLRRLGRSLPTFFFAFLMAAAVWVTSVTQADPNIKQVYPRPLSISVVGQNPGTVLTNINPKQVPVTIDAPKSIWDRINSEDGLVAAEVDLSGLGPGTHSVRVQVHVNASPATFTVTPQSVSVTLEKLSATAFPVHFVKLGEPAIGFQVGTEKINVNNVTVSGPDSAVSRVVEVRSTVDLTLIHDSINQTLPLQPLDKNEAVVEGVTLNPDKVSVQIPITQRYGFRTVSVKVVVIGQVASGFRVTNISVSPLAITVSSSDPQSVNNLPGYVETQPVSLDGIKNALDTQVKLNLPNGFRVEGDSTVLVQVGIAAIESNLTLRNIPVQATGLTPGLGAKFSPDAVDIILSGPLPELDALTINDISVSADLSGKAQGSYQVTPSVQITINDLRVVSIQPGTVQATVGPAPTPTPTVTPTRRP